MIQKQKCIHVFLGIGMFILGLSVMSSAQFSQRSLLEKRIFYVESGKVGSCDYWSMPLGKFTVSLRRYYPGKDTVTYATDMNFSFLSNGYIEGNGYSEIGKIGSEAEFGYDEGGEVKRLSIKDIDYIYQDGKKVHLADGQDKDLLIYCEGTSLSPEFLQLMIWKYDPVYKELKHLKDLPSISAFSFTKEGAQRALKSK